MECATKCRWNKGGKCLLFAGQSLLECRYRTPPNKPKRAVKTNTKGK